MIHHAVSVVGFIVFAGIAWLLSSNRRKIAWRTIAWGVALQLLIGLIIFRLPVSHRVLLWLNDAVLVLLNASKSGSVFLFGPLAASPGESGSRFHPHLSSSSSGVFFVAALPLAPSPASAANLGALARLSIETENQRRRITLQCGNLV